LENTFQKIPFLRIALAFGVGIVVGNYFYVSAYTMLIVLLILLFVVFTLHKKYHYKVDSVFGLTALLYFLVLGTFIFNTYNTKPYFSEKGIALGTIVESPQEKQNSYKSIVEIDFLKSGDSIFQTKEKVLVYFAKSERVKALNPGNQILINTIPQTVTNYGNPFEFDYKRYLKQKRIYRQIYLNEESWDTTTHNSLSPQIHAELLREQLLKIYHNQNLGSNETEILSALTLGYKRNLDPETKRIFSAAGAMHVLAVSGLHVGIIFLVFNFLFGFLKKQKIGRAIFIIAGILLLWGYAFITGLSPSVLRAATMFSIVIVGSNLNRKASIYNSLAASAFFLLLLNPNNLFEVGFQLSYLAVFGIVFLQPKLEKLWPVKNKILNYFWGLVCVSLAAQIATFPLTAFYFNQFPTYFLLTNIIIIPAVILLIPMGISLLIFSQVALLSNVIAFLVKWIIKGVYFVLQFIELLPHSTINVTLSHIALSLLIAFLFFAFLFISSKQTFHLKMALSVLLLFAISILATNLKQHFSRELIVFNTTNPTILLVTGRKSYVISKYKIEKDDFIYRDIQNFRRKKRLIEPTFIQINDSYEDQFLVLKNGLLFFEGKTTLLNTNRITSDFIPNYILVEKNFEIKNAPITTQSKIILLKNSYSSNKTSNLYSIKNSGAFYDIWKASKTQQNYSGSIQYKK